MMRWMVITTVVVCGMLTAGGTAADRPGVPVAKPQVELEIRLIERARDKEAGLIPSVGGVLTPAETKRFIAELTTNPRVKVLAAPRLRAEVGRNASFRIGGEFPRDALESKPGEIPTQVYDFVGTALDANVSISATGSLVINLLCEQSERNATGKGVSSLNQRRVETRVELQNGQTVLLSSDRPAEAQRAELIVLVTATLVENAAELSRQSSLPESLPRATEGTAPPEVQIQEQPR